MFWEFFFFIYFDDMNSENEMKSRNDIIRIEYSFQPWRLQIIQFILRLLGIPYGA